MLNVLLASAQINSEDQNEQSWNTVDIENYINVKVFPNPTKGMFYVQLDDTTPFDVTVYAMNGMIVYSQKNVQERKHKIEFQNTMAKGFYQVALHQGGNSIVKKLIIN